MAEVVYKTIFKFKRGSAEAWARVNPVLQEGEPGYELDTGRLKIGNGSTEWNSLAYFGGDVSISSDGKSITLSTTGLLELYGFSAATVNQIPSKGENDALVWIDKDIPLTEEEILEVLV